MTMKILQAISHYVPAYRFGGPLQVAHALGKELVGRGHEVSVCTTNLADEHSVLDVPVDKAVLVEGVSVYYQRVLRWRRWGYSPGLSRRLGQLVQDCDAMLVHSHFQYAGWAGARIARHAGKPYVVFAHGSLKRDSLRASSGWRKRLYLGLLEHANMRGARGIAFNAQEEMDDSLYARNGVVLPNGIAESDFAALLPRGEFRAQHPDWNSALIFLFLGRIDIQQKGVDIIVEAFARVVAERADARLLLAGPSEGSDAVRVRSMVAAYGLEGCVSFLGLVSGRRKLQLLRDADVFLMPSRYEGLSISLLEAMASELPVVLSNRAGLHQEVARRGCGIVVSPKIEETAVAMRQFFDAARRQRCGANGRKLVLEQHTWPVIADRLEQVLMNRTLTAKP